MRSQSSPSMRRAAGQISALVDSQSRTSKAKTVWYETFRETSGQTTIQAGCIMTVAKTGAEHIASLRDGRTVYIDGQLVPDVTTHPAFRNSVKSAGALYDFQAQPENLELMTFTPEGSSRRVNRAWKTPRSYEEMVQRRKALQAGTRGHYGFNGPSTGDIASPAVCRPSGLY